MPLSKEEIKAWLRKSGRDRFWLAEKCEVNKGTVDKWLSTERNIPAKASLIIKQLMLPEKSVPFEHRSYSLVNGIAAVAIPLSRNDLETLEKAAAKQGVTVEEFIYQAALEDAEASLHNPVSKASGLRPPSSSGNQDKSDEFNIVRGTGDHHISNLA